MGEIEATQAFFAGEWTLHRRIVDFRARAEARFEGRARLIGDRSGPGALTYEERGEMRVNGAALAAERRYRWRCQAQGRVEIRFDTDAPFCAFDLGRPGAAPAAWSADLHLCAPDRYEGRLIALWPRQIWRWRWRVTGPVKNYLSVSDYRRL